MSWFWHLVIFFVLSAAGAHHITKRWLSIQRFIFLLMFCFETPKKDSYPTNFWTEPSFAILSAISFPHTYKDWC